MQKIKLYQKIKIVKLICKYQKNLPVSINIFPPKITQFESQEQLYESAYLNLEENILSHQSHQGNCRIALSGGFTPMELYQKIGKSPIIDWQKLEIFQTDERFIDQNDQRSNQFQIRKSLGLEACTKLEENFNIYWLKSDEKLEKCLDKYNEILENLDGVWFDEVILGIGSDGHIASLFPSGSYLKHQENRVIATETSVFEVTQRLSLTLESVLNSSKITILLVGANKSEVLQELVEGKMSAIDFPAKFLLAHPNVHILACFE